MSHSCAKFPRAKVHSLASSAHKNHPTNGTFFPTYGLAPPGAAATIAGMSHLNLSPTSLRRLRRPAPGRKQSGFSLLEALVSIVILSFGLLGVAGLQASSLKYTRDARNQSVAVNLAREMAEMIRSNARESGKVADNPYLVDEEGNAEVINIPNAPATCLDAGENCATPAELAAAQREEWKYRVGQALPGARVAVCMDSAPYDANGLPQWGCTAGGNIIAIKIGWDRDDLSGKPLLAQEMPPYDVFPVTPAGQQQ